MGKCIIPFLVFFICLCNVSPQGLHPCVFNMKTPPRIDILVDLVIRQLVYHITLIREGFMTLGPPLRTNFCFDGCVVLIFRDRSLCTKHEEPIHNRPFCQSRHKATSLLHDVDTIKVYDSGSLIKNLEFIYDRGLWVEIVELSTIGDPHE